MSNLPELQSLLDLLPQRPALSRQETECLLTEARPWALTHKILVPFAAGSRSLLNCPFCETHTVRPVPRDGAVMYHCPDGGWRRLAPPDQDAFTLCPLSFARQLASALGLDPDRILMREEDRLYELGLMSVGDLQRSVFFLASGSALTETEALLARLDARGSKNAGIVLTCQPFPLSLRSKAAHRFVPVSEIAELTASGLSILNDRLDQWLTGQDRPPALRSEDKAYLRRGEWKEPFKEARRDLMDTGRWQGSQAEKIEQAKEWCRQRQIGIRWPQDLSVLKKHLRRLEQGTD
mgnify:CR=1 FL=1